MQRLARRTVRKSPRKRRRRSPDVQLSSLPERLKQLADRAKREAADLPPGEERESCRLKAAQAENVLEFVRLLQSQP
jgi:hypothetical protein